MKKISLFGLSILAVVILACGPNAKNANNTQVPKSWKTYNEGGYSIQYPDSFYLDRSGKAGAAFALLSNQTSQQDRFRENINLIIQNLAGQNIDLNKYVQISQDQIKSMITDGTVIESTRMKKNGLEYQKIIYTGMQGMYGLKWMQYYWIKNEKAYVLTLTCEADQYDHYAEIGEKIMDTFTLK